MVFTWCLRFIVDIFPSTNVKTNKQKELNILEYLILFLNSYDIAVDETFSDNSDNDLINASVLGMVFEKLNGYRDGSFFTPSYITEYITNKTIGNLIVDKFNKNYFEGKTVNEIGDNINRKNINTARELFNSITICDPAVGSGHFLVSALNAMLLYKAQLGLYESIKYNQLEIVDDMLIVKNISDYDKDMQNSDTHNIYKELYKSKQQIISNSLFGVDINPKSIYISRLRLWIELLKHTYFTDNKSLALLPNIDINIKQGNSVLSDIKLNEDFNTLFNASTFQEYKELISQYKNPINKRDDIKKKIDDIKSKLNDNYDDKNRFEWRYEFPEILDDNGNFKGFDIILSNPPYIGEKGNKHIFRPLKEQWKDRYKTNSDIFYFFIMKAIDILKEDGISGFITTNYFLTADGADTVRKELKERTAIYNIINFNEMKLFKSASGQHNIINIFKKTTNILKTNIINVISSQNISQKQLFNNSDDVEIFIVKSNELYDGDKNYIRVSKQGDQLESIFNKMILNSKLLGTISNVNQGLRTGADKISKKHLQTYPNLGNIGDGIFILNKEELLNLNLSSIELSKIVKPLYKNSDINKYNTKSDFGDFLLYIDKKLSETEFQEIYPNVYKYLSKFKDLMYNIRSKNNEKAEFWFTIDRARSENIFIDNKIIAPQRSKINTFAYNETSWYASADVYYITNRSDFDIELKYLVALLNSKLYYIWLYYKGKRKGEMLELYATPLSQIPIKIIVKEKQKIFISLVNQIIELKKENKSTVQLENNINKEVYNLYNLTDEEIVTIENIYNNKHQSKKKPSDTIGQGKLI